MPSNKGDSPSPSSEGDIYDDLPTNAIHASYAHEFEVRFGSFPWKEIELFESNRPVYYCELSELTRNKPDVTLRKGAKGSAVVGACHFWRSRSLTCGLGSDETSMEWIEMQRQGMLKPSAFAFEWGGKHYTLRKAKSGDVGEGGLSSLLQTHFKVVDDASGSIVGLYVSESGLGRRKGSLKITAGVDEDLQPLIVLDIMSWRSKISRDARRWASASAGSS